MDKISEMIYKIEDTLYGQISNGIEQIDTEEFGKVADILKDLASAKKNCKKAEYYETVTEAMGEADEDEERRYYGGRSRDSRGRYISRRRGYTEMPEYMPDYDMDAKQYEKLRDMDRYSMGRMYYTENGSSNNGSNTRDYREGRAGMSRKGYMESKEMHNSGTEADKMKNRQELEKWIDDIGTDVKSALGEMSAEERTVMKQKLATLSNSL